jgi:plastocyanin
MDSPAANLPSPMTATVNATPSISFAPSPLSVAPGGTVTFAFGSVGHNVFFDAVPDAPADIPGTNANSSATRTFPAAGTFTYTCHIHPGMKGTIVVAATVTASDTGYTGY